jgi:hypothetical protein
MGAVLVVIMRVLVMIVGFLLGRFLFGTCTVSAAVLLFFMRILFGVFVGVLIMGVIMGAAVISMRLFLIMFVSVISMSVRVGARLLFLVAGFVLMAAGISHFVVGVAFVFVRLMRFVW